MKKILFLLFLLFSFYYSLFPNKYYVCFASFNIKSNAEYLQKKLNRENIPVFIKEILIKDKLFYRVIYQPTFSDYHDAHKKLLHFENNQVIISEKLSTLWILIEKENEISIEKNPKVSNPEIKTEMTKEGIKLLNKQSLLSDLTTDANITPGRVIFALNAIPNNNKPAVTTKENFEFPETVYARAYFPGQIGIINAEDFWHELWIDGKLVMRKYFKIPPEPDWDQIQVWVSEDEYQEQIKNLSPGNHKLTLAVYQNFYQVSKTNKKNNNTGEITSNKEKFQIPRVISTGTFFYKIP